jgi:hypothetical protein
MHGARETMSDIEEPAITINGTSLSQGQAMTLRVACNAYLTELDDPTALGDDEHGRHMRNAYRERLKEVLLLMQEPAKR